MIVDVWREHTSYEVDLEEEETTDMDLNVINTGGMDVICGEAMAPSSKGKFLLVFYGFTSSCIYMWF